MGLSSCGTFIGFTASLSLGEVSPTAWRPTQKFGALRPRGSGEPAGEYLPPSTHRLFSFCAPSCSLSSCIQVFSQQGGEHMKLFLVGALCLAALPAAAATANAYIQHNLVADTP